MISSHTLYEMARTFESGATASIERGKTLFSYLKGFVDLGIPCAKETMEILVAEMTALKFRNAHVEAFLNQADYILLRREVDRLAFGNSGEAAEKLKNFIRERRQLASNSRAKQSVHLQHRTDTKQALKNVRPEDLMKWLEAQTGTSVAVDLLADHLRNQFPDAPTNELTEWATALLSIPFGRMARSIIKSDLYYNWRCANRESNPSDLLDDMHHVLNAMYCEIYATAESRQAEYAQLLLTPATRVRTYDGGAPIDQWLLSLV